jgi:hypothetical protein
MERTHMDERERKRERERERERNHRMHGSPKEYLIGYFYFQAEKENVTFQIDILKCEVIFLRNVWNIQLRDREYR